MRVLRACEVFDGVLSYPGRILVEMPVLRKDCLNGCRTCGCDFSSVKAFDAHRVGKHDYRYDAEHLDGRRCLDTDEMVNAGMELDERGRWRIAADAERIRAYHAAA